MDRLTGVVELCSRLTDISEASTVVRGYVISDVVVREEKYAIVSAYSLARSVSNSCNEYRLSSGTTSLSASVFPPLGLDRTV